jgi:hypothetical protein
MIGRLEPAIGSALRVGPVVEATAGERTAQALMKEQEQESNLDAFCREAVGIARSVPLQQAVSLELAQIVSAAGPEPLHIEETDANFTVEWKGHYRIEGDAFIYVDRKTGRTRTILGYPTQKLEDAARGARGN